MVTGPGADSASLAQLIERYGAMGLAGLLVGFLIREVIKRLDKQIEIASSESAKTDMLSRDVDALKSSHAELVKAIAALASGVAELSRVQQDHIRMTREQIQLTKMWHEKVDRAWRPEGGA